MSKRFGTKSSWANQFGAASYTQFEIAGQTYGKLVFSDGNGPNLAETKTMVDTIGKELGGAQMLTYTESRAIVDKEGTPQYRGFQSNLEKGEWFYITDAEAESRSRAAWLYRYRDGRWLGAIGGDRPDVAARVVVFKLESKLHAKGAATVVVEDADGKPVGSIELPKGGNVHLLRQ